MVTLDTLVDFLVAPDISEEGEEVGGCETKVSPHEDVLVSEVTLLTVIDSTSWEGEVNWQGGLEGQGVLETGFEQEPTRRERRLFHFN